MAFGFPACATGRRNHSCRRDLLASAVQEALDGLGWGYETVSPDHLEARVPAGIWSWGEKLNITISYDGAVTATSECVLATQCFDWGKNQRNVEEFFDQLSRKMAAREPSPVQKPLQEGHGQKTHEPPTAPFDERGMTPIERVFGDGKEDE